MAHINNTKFLLLLKEYNLTKEIPKELHIKFHRLAKHYGHLANFRNYTYIEDMISEAYLRCIKVANKFDCETKTNPFAYFTTVVHNSFIQFIQKEKRQQDFKWKEMKTIVEFYKTHYDIDLELTDDMKEKMYSENKSDKSDDNETYTNENDTNSEEE